MTIIIAILIIVLSYLFGGFSTARIIAKSVRSLNVYKVGTGLADTENIYTNISKPMGVLVGTIDLTKAYVYLMIVEFVLRKLGARFGFVDLEVLYSYNMMLAYGWALLVGHCLPITHKFQGGRGIFTYLGIITYFSLSTTALTAVVAAILVWKFHQVRFAQYTIVILPLILFQIFYSFSPAFAVRFPAHFNLILAGTCVFMGMLNIIVSKRLGEF
nr:acyl phosphate:glycerol-3-phosphate acyltransferase [Candidatus Cloacimonadota bacterium]